MRWMFKDGLDLDSSCIVVGKLRDCSRLNVLVEFFSFLWDGGAFRPCTVQLAERPRNLESNEKQRLR